VIARSLTVAALAAHGRRATNRAARVSKRAGALAAVLLGLAAAWAQQADMSTIPAGSFERGRSHALPDDGLKWFPELLKDDRPVRTITLDAFSLDVHEVTSREYAEMVAAGQAKAPFYWPGGQPAQGKEDDPVANVTWAEAAAYCAWRGKRLPTEAEWEKTCRGGAGGMLHPWGDEPADARRAHFDSITGPVKVCSFEKNAYGLCDMAGNVWEWSADWYGKDYYADAPEANPRGPATGEYRVLRGGSWADEAKYLTCAHRSYARPVERSPNIGFRCAQ
jgi:formylglycine-generating enzyme required for sulfatase activity